MLLDLGVELVMVFDGGRLPRKDVTEHGRKRCAVQRVVRKERRVGVSHQSR